MRFLKGQSKQLGDNQAEDLQDTEMSMAMDEECLDFQDLDDEDNLMQEEPLDHQYFGKTASNYQPSLIQDIYAMDAFSKSPCYNLNHYQHFEPQSIQTEVIPSKKSNYEMSFQRTSREDELFSLDEKKDQFDTYSFIYGFEDYEDSQSFTTPIFTKETEIIEKKCPIAQFEIFSHFGEAGGMVPEDLNEKRPICNCSKSQCLKLYCICFRKGVTCHHQCKCVGCLNTKENIEKIKLKRSQKVSRKILEGDEGTCNCKMSFCEKSYCPCAKSGKGCSKVCRCFHCKNPHGAKR